MLNKNVKVEKKKQMPIKSGMAAFMGILGGGLVSFIAYVVTIDYDTHNFFGSVDVIWYFLVPSLLLGLLGGLIGKRWGTIGSAVLGGVFAILPVGLVYGFFMLLYTLTYGS